MVKWEELGSNEVDCEHLDSNRILRKEKRKIGKIEKGKLERKVR